MQIRGGAAEHKQLATRRSDGQDRDLHQHGPDKQNTHEYALGKARHHHEQPVRAAWGGHDMPFLRMAAAGAS